MRTAIFIFIFQIFFLSGKGQELNKWHSIDSAVAQANINKKLVMVECYMPNCPHCFILNKNLKDTSIVNLINENYEFVQLDLSESKNLKQLQNRKINILATPTFLFFNTDGNLVNFLYPPEEKEGLAKALEIRKSTDDLRFQTVDTTNSDTKITNLATFYRITGDIEANNRIADIIFEKLIVQKDNAKLWAGFHQYTASTENKIFKYWINNVALADSFTSGSKHTQNILGSRVQQRILHLLDASEIKEEDLKNVEEYLQKIGHDEERLFLWSWQVHYLYLIKKRDFPATTTYTEEVLKHYARYTTYYNLIRFVSNNSRKGDQFFRNYVSSLAKRGIGSVNDKSQKWLIYSGLANYYLIIGDKTAALAALKEAEAISPDEVAIFKAEHRL